MKANLIDNIMLGIFGIGIILFGPLIVTYECLKWCSVKVYNLLLQKTKQESLTEYDFDIDGFDISMYLLGLVMLICSPFIAIYYILKWTYACMPWEIARRIKRNKEIHELEERLGLKGRNSRTRYYDAYYCKNQDSDRVDYLNNLRKKLVDGYKSPDIIIAAERIENHSCLSERFNARYNALLLASKEYYNIPKDEIESLRKRRNIFLMCGREDYYNNPKLLLNADIYFEEKWHGEIKTFSECGNYQDYYCIQIPGEFAFREIKDGNSKIMQFVEQFKQECGRKDVCKDLIGLY